MRKEKLPSVGIIGCGNMGASLAVSLSRKASVSIFDVQQERQKQVKKQAPVVFVRTLEELILKSAYIILAVKPQDMDTALREVRSVSLKIPFQGKTFISIAAGLSVGFFKQRLPVGSAIARTMPNIGLKAGQSYTAICFGTGVSAVQKKDVQRILSAAGAVVVVKEESIDKITAISGSGPGYIFNFLGALQKSAVELGFTQAEAERMVRMTFIGTARLLEQEPLAFDAWAGRVCSKGGTTEAALEHLRGNKFDKLVIEATAKAYARAKELSKK